MEGLEIHVLLAMGRTLLPFDVAPYEVDEFHRLRSTPWTKSVHSNLPAGNSRASTQHVEAESKVARREI